MYIGSIQGGALTEYIMEHIAHTLKKDALEIRMNNILKQGDPLLISIGEIFNPTGLAKFDTENLIPRMIEEIKESADYENRLKLVEKFNQVNTRQAKSIKF